MRGSSSSAGSRCCRPNRRMRSRSSSPLSVPPTPSRPRSTTWSSARWVYHRALTAPCCYRRLLRGRRPPAATARASRERTGIGPRDHRPRARRGGRPRSGRAATRHRADHGCTRGAGARHRPRPRPPPRRPRRRSRRRRAPRHRLRPRSVGRGDRRGPARTRAPDLRHVSRDARPRVRARGRARAVRAADRALPSRTPPTGRRAGGRGIARRRARRSRTRHRIPRPARSPRRSRDALRRLSPRTANRCWRGSASPPITRSTAT